MHKADQDIGSENIIPIASSVVNVGCHIHKGKSHEIGKATVNAASDRSFGERAQPRNREVRKMHNEKTPEMILKAHGKLLHPQSHSLETFALSRAEHRFVGGISSPSELFKQILCSLCPR
jgi:hypothetical protein